MKYIEFKLIFYIGCFLSPLSLMGQNIRNDIKNTDNRDSIAAYTKTLDIKQNKYIQVAFDTIKKQDIVGDISSVNVPKILEKNNFTYSLDGMQALIPGFNGTIKGMSNYLVLIDGIPRDPASIIPSAIQQITFLKGVSATALYGSRAVNGVVYITTKRGANHDIKFDVNVEGGAYIPKEYPHYLDAAEYMSLYNEARQNDGLSKLYSQTDIYKTSTGEHPYRYPNTDYYSSQFLKDFYDSYRANMQVSGGSSTAHFYTNLNYTSVGTLLDFGEGKGNRNNQFRFRGNADFELSNTISTFVEAAVIYDDNKGVNTNYWGESATLQPNRFTPLIPIDKFIENNPILDNIVSKSSHIVDGNYLLGGNQIFETNPIATVYGGGTGSYVGRQFQFNVGFNMNLGRVLKGLSFHSLVGVDYQTSFTESYNEQYAVYEPTWVSYNGIDQIGSLTKFGKDSKTGKQNVSNSVFKQTLSFSGRFNYNRTLNGGNNISAILTANGFQITNSGEYHRTANVNLGLLLGYNYRHKYYLNFNIDVPHSAKLPKGNREAISHTLALGWRLNKENFLNEVSAISNLKVFISAGVLNTDMSIPGYYLYQSYYTQADGQYFGWRDGALRKGTDSRREANPNLTYVKKKEINIGFKSSFFNHLISFGGNFYINRMSGGVIQPAVLYPTYFRTYYPDISFLPYVNYNVDQRKGVSFNIDFNKKIKQLKFSLGITGNYFDSKAIKRSEINQYDYQNAVGKPLDGIWGLESLGLFSSQQEVDNSPEQKFGDVKPGDIKYKDQNGDGVIDDQDVIYLGKAGWYGASPFAFGVHLTINWNKWTLFLLGTGQFGSKGMKDNDYYWVNGEDKYSAIVRNRWTKKTKNTADYPRLTTKSGSNNFRPSNFWMYSSNQFSLNRFQLTYDFSKKDLGSLPFNELQVYLYGSDLIRFAKNPRVLRLDIGGAPQTRFLKLGVKANF